MSLARYLANLLNSSGQVPDAKLVALTASKLTGQVPDANAPSGSVIQVVQSIKQTNVTINTTGQTATMIDVGHSASITPSSASNKILVFLTGETSTVYISGVSGENHLTAIGLYRGSTNLGGIGAPNSYLNGFHVQQNCDTGGNNFGEEMNAFSICYLDSPASTSAQTYSARVGCDFAMNITYGGRSNATCQLTLMEIAG